MNKTQIKAYPKPKDYLTQFLKFYKGLEKMDLNLYQEQKTTIPSPLRRGSHSFEIFKLRENNSSIKSSQIAILKSCQEVELILMSKI